MDGTTFDRVAKLLSTRRTRRSAVGGGIGAAATAAFAPLAARTKAQDATPEVTTSGDPHPSADDAVKTEYLFVQPFDGGSWGPKDGEDGVYTLALTDAPAQTVYFSDRPERIFGLAPTRSFLDGLGFPPENPPNAALVAARVDGGEEVLIVELLNPVYDDAAGTLRYDAKVLADYGGAGLAGAARRQQDYEVPERFAGGGLFIDDCQEIGIACFADGGHYVGETRGETCWDPNHAGGSCVVCRADRACAAAYPDDCRAPWHNADGTSAGYILTCSPKP